MKPPIKENVQNCYESFIFFVCLIISNLKNCAFCILNTIMQQIEIDDFNITSTKRYRNSIPPTLMKSAHQTCHLNYKNMRFACCG